MPSLSKIFIPAALALSTAGAASFLTAYNSFSSEDNCRSKITGNVETTDGVSITGMFVLAKNNQGDVFEIDFTRDNGEYELCHRDASITSIMALSGEEISLDSNILNWYLGHVFGNDIVMDTITIEPFGNEPDGFDV